MRIRSGSESTCGYLVACAYINKCVYVMCARFVDDVICIHCGCKIWGRARATLCSRETGRRRRGARGCQNTPRMCVCVHVYSSRRSAHSRIVYDLSAGKVVRRYCVTAADSGQNRPLPPGSDERRFIAVVVGLLLLGAANPGTGQMVELPRMCAKTDSN